MRRKKRGIILSITIVILASLACNYPQNLPATPSLFSTPDLTMTAVYLPPSVQPAPTQSIPPTTSASTPTLVNPPVTGGTETTEMVQVPAATTAVPTVVYPTFTFPPPTIAPPTFTQIYPVSYEGPAIRKGTSLVARYFDKKPSIDGDFSEWILDKTMVTNVVYGANQWHGENDLSGRVTFAWDESYLYIAAKVKDDIYAQNAKGKALFKGDSVEILVDTNVSGDFYKPSLDKDDFQIGVSPGNPLPGAFPQAYLWYPEANSGMVYDALVGAVAIEGGYRVEAAIPWAVMGVKPAKGKHLGFVFSISDNDRQDQNVQQSMVSTSPNRHLTDPTTWGDLALIYEQAQANPQDRPGASISATYLATKPVIDGNLSEWRLADNLLPNVVFGNEKWEGMQDLFGSVMVGWDENFLFLGVKVTDDRYVQRMTKEKIYLGDSLEILLDADVGSDYYVQALNGDDYQIGISPGRPEPGAFMEAFRWYPANRAGAGLQIIASALPTTEGYTVEAALPWNIFGIQPANGYHYGFAFSISDNDNADRDVQQTMISNIAFRKLTDPTTWGDLHLTKP